MRILFIHASWDESPEYKVHRILAEHADSDAVDCLMVWQDSTHDRARNHPARLARANRNIFWDFGRNMSLTPKPSRARRAAMMLWRLPASVWFLWRTIQRFNPDLIYTSQQRYDLFLVRLLQPLIRRPHLIHLHYTVGPWLGRSAYRTVLKHRHLLACSDFVRQGAIEAGVPPQHVDTIHNPADVERFMIAADRRAIQAEFGWGESTPVVVAVGRLDPSKGHMLLLEAFAQVVHCMPEARLLICGQTTMRGDYDEILRKRAANLGLSRAVIFTGMRSDIPSIYLAADIFCLPAEDEPFGLVFVEAMVARLPVVACRSGGVPEVVVDRETGFLSEVGDAEGLAGILLSLLGDGELRRRMGEAARNRALTTFAPATIAAQWTSLLRQRFHALSGQEGDASHAIQSLTTGR
jgi:glycosyltransferase involved in cell wall biosynthesis